MLNNSITGFSLTDTSKTTTALLTQLLSENDSSFIQNVSRVISLRSSEGFFTGYGIRYNSGYVAGIISPVSSSSLYPYNFFYYGGADAVLKKLGSDGKKAISLGNVNSGGTINVKSYYDDYSTLTASNFVLQANGGTAGSWAVPNFREFTGTWGVNPTYNKPSCSYNASTGVLTVSGNNMSIYCTATSYSGGVSPNYSNSVGSSSNISVWLIV